VKTKPIQSQFKPNLLNAQMNVSAVLRKDYENKPRFRTPGKQTQSNPIPPSPSKAGFCISKKKMKKIDFLLDKNKIKFNIVKDEQCFLKNILCKDS
jgi:hypothetical protein